MPVDAPDEALFDLWPSAVNCATSFTARLRRSRSLRRRCGARPSRCRKVRRALCEGVSGPEREAYAETRDAEAACRVCAADLCKNRSSSSSLACADLLLVRSVAIKTADLGLNYGACRPRVLLQGRASVRRSPALISKACSDVAAVGFKIEGVLARGHSRRARSARARMQDDVAALILHAPAPGGIVAIGDLQGGGFELHRHGGIAAAVDLDFELSADRVGPELGFEGVALGLDDELGLQGGAAGPLPSFGRRRRGGRDAR